MGEGNDDDDHHHHGLHTFAHVGERKLLDIETKLDFNVRVGCFVSGDLSNRQSLKQQRKQS
jgi:hypothetical protein